MAGTIEEKSKIEYYVSQLRSLKAQVLNLSEKLEEVTTSLKFNIQNNKMQISLLEYQLKKAEESGLTEFCYDYMVEEYRKHHG